MGDDGGKSDESDLFSAVSAQKVRNWSTVELIEGESSIGFAIIASLSEVVGLSNVLILLLGGFPPALFLAASSDYWWLFWLTNLLFIFLILSMMEYLFARSMYH